MIGYKCTQCGFAGNARDDQASMFIDCPKCGATIDVPPGEWARKEPAADSRPLNVPGETIALKETDWLEILRDLIRAIPALAVLGSGLAFMATLHEPDAGGVVHYLALLTAVGVFSSYAIKRFVPAVGVRLLCAAAVAISAAAVWGHFDYSIRRWHEPTAHVKGERTYVDHTYRGRSTPFYRSYDETWDSGYFFSAEGGFSDSFRQHGHWHVSIGDYISLTTTVH